MGKHKRLIQIILMITVLCSCGQRTVSWQSKNETLGFDRIISIEDSLPPINGYCHMYLKGDTLFIHDFKSSGDQFKLFSIIDNKYIGSFGKPGNGPGEILNFGNIMFDREANILYGLNSNTWEIIGFNIDEALSNQEYKPSVKIKLDFEKELIPILNAHYVNDSTVFCNTYTLKDNTVSTQVSNLNLLTGEIKSLDNYPFSPKYRNAITVSTEKNRIIAADRTNDRVRILDLNGNLQKIVLGKDYDEAIEPQTAYFDSPIVVNDSVYILYTGKGKNMHQTANQIIVIDLEGNHVRTFTSEVPFIQLAYHKPTNRLYFNSDSAPQFGYINL